MRLPRRRMLVERLQSGFLPRCSVFKQSTLIHNRFDPELRCWHVQKSLLDRDDEVHDLKCAVESAKDTIVAQNQHITNQENTIRQVKRSLQAREQVLKTQVESLQGENDHLQAHLER